MRRTGVILAFIALCYVQLSASSAVFSINTKLERIDDCIRYETVDSKNNPNVALNNPKDGAKNKTKQEFYKYVKDFVEDSLQIIVRDSNHYKTRDEELQAKLDTMQKDQGSFDSRLTAIENFKGTVEGKLSDTQLWIRVLLFGLAFVMIVVLVAIIWLVRGLESEIVTVVTDNNGEIKKWVKRIAEKPSIASMPKSYDSEIRGLQKENRDLKERIVELEDDIRLLKKKPDVKVEEQQSVMSRSVESQKLLYADSIIDGEFSHVWERENDDTVFVLTKKTETRASININKRAYNKVLANASFLDGCDKQIVDNHIVVIQCEGEAERGSDGKWKVVSPLKVELR